MKKLLLGFSLIAVFGIGITAASFTLPENTIVEVKEGDDKKKDKKKKKAKASCCKPEAKTSCCKPEAKGKSCCKKPATES